MGYLTISTNVRRHETHHRWHFFFQKDSALVHMHCACNTVQLLRHSRLPFSWTMPPSNSAELNALITRLGSHTVASVWVVSQKDWKKSRSDWLNSGNALIQHLSEKMRFSCFPVLPVSAEARVIWDDTVKRLFIAYFIGNISAKKYKNVFTCVKVIANQRWDVLWDTLYNVSAQEMAKHRAKFGWPPVSDVAAVTKARRETGWNLLGRPKLTKDLSR